MLYLVTRPDYDGTEIHGLYESGLTASEVQALCNAHEQAVTERNLALEQELLRFDAANPRPPFRVREDGTPCTREDERADLARPFKFRSLKNNPAFSVWAQKRQEVLAQFEATYRGHHRPKPTLGAYLVSQGLRPVEFQEISI